MRKFMTRVIKAAQNDEEYIGFCIKCGTKHLGVEPDARRYDCKKCKLPKVFGAQEILLMMVQ